MFDPVALVVRRHFTDHSLGRGTYLGQIRLVDEFMSARLQDPDHLVLREAARQDDRWQAQGAFS